jgi:hypothetical protein
VRPRPFSATPFGGSQRTRGASMDILKFLSPMYWIRDRRRDRLRAALVDLHILAAEAQWNSRPEAGELRSELDRRMAQAPAEIRRQVASEASLTYNFRLQKAGRWQPGSGPSDGVQALLLQQAMAQAMRDMRGVDE